MLLTLALTGTRNTIVSGQPTISGNQVQWQPSGKTLQFGPDDNYDITTLSYSPDGKYIAATDSGQPTTLQCWLVSDGSMQTKAFTVSGQTQLTAMAWCPKAGSTLVAAASLNGPVYIWDRKQGPNPIRTLHNANIVDRAPLLTWSADGQWLAAGYQDDEDSILVWHV
jgi:WD40 repeat protein